MVQAGTTNRVKIAGATGWFFANVNDPAADISLGTVYMPTIGGDVVHARLNIHIIDMFIGGNTETGMSEMTGLPYIQVRKPSGTFTTGISTQYLRCTAAPAGDAIRTRSLFIPGSADVSAEVNDITSGVSYEVQWKDFRFVNAPSTGGGIIHIGYAVELEVFYTKDDDISVIFESVYWRNNPVTADGSKTVFIVSSYAGSGLGDDFCKDCQMIMTTGSNAGQVRRISAYNDTTGQFTVDTAFINDVLTGDEFTLVFHYTPELKSVVDSIQTDVTTIDGKADTIIGSTISDSGAVVADGNNSTTYFRTNLAKTTANYYTNLQVLFLTGNNAGQARRISAYSVADFITVSDALNAIPTAGDTFLIIGRVAGAGSALTEAAIATEVWNRNKSGHTGTNTFGKIVQDTETTANAIKVVTDTVNGKLPTNNIMGSSVKTDKDDEIDAIKVSTDNMNPKVNTIHGKLPSANYLRGTSATTGRFDSNDKTDIYNEAWDALQNYDPPTKTELDAAEARIIVEVDANEAKIDIVTNMVAQIQNNVFFSSTVREMYQRPDSGSTTFSIKAQVFDNIGNPEDPDSNELYIKLTGSTTGVIVASTLMTRLDVGIYEYQLVVLSTATLEVWEFEFAYEEGAVAKKHYRKSELTEWTSDINDIQTKVTAIHVKVDAVAPTPTIPAQISTHDTDIKALPNIQATPEYLVIPSGMTRINQEGGVTDVDTDIPLYDTDAIGKDGDDVIVLIGSEYITGTIDSTNSQLTSCTRGAYSTAAAAHADLVSVYEVMIHPIRLNFFDNEQNMVTPDAAPTIEIVDWAGVQEIAPTAMTKIVTGVYGYNYFLVAGYISESKTLRFSATINAITTVRQSIVMVLDKPASQNDLLDIAGGGTGEFMVTQDGYMDRSGIFHFWTDVMKGYLRDATTGSRLDDVLVTAYRVVNGQTILAKIPPGQVVCDVNGNYEMRLDAGTYVFKFHKDQYRFPTDEVSRTVTA